MSEQRPPDSFVGLVVEPGEGVGRLVFFGRQRAKLERAVGGPLSAILPERGDWHAYRCAEPLGLGRNEMADAVLHALGLLEEGPSFGTVVFVGTGMLGEEADVPVGLMMLHAQLVAIRAAS